MGHAGASTMHGGSDARAKIRALEEAGATMVTHPAQFGNVLEPLLKQRIKKADSMSAHSMVSCHSNPRGDGSDSCGLFRKSGRQICTRNETCIRSIEDLVGIFNQHSGSINGETFTLRALVALTC